MTKQLSVQEFENLSAYLDGELTSQEQSRLEHALEHSSELRQALDELRRTRIILRSASRLRAPRNFTLTAAMVGAVKPARKSFFAFNALRFSSALASILLVLTIIGEWFTFSGPLAAPVAMVSEPANQAEALPPDAALKPASTPEAAELRQSAPQEPSARGLETPSQTPLPTGEISMFAAEATPGDVNALEAPMAGSSALVAETPTAEALLAEETPAEELDALAMPADETAIALAEQPAEPMAYGEPAPSETGDAVAMQPTAPEETSNSHLPWRLAQVAMLVLAVLTAAGAYLIRHSSRSRTP